MNTKLKRVAVVALATVAVIGLAAPAQANEQRGSGTGLSTDGPCYQHWDANFGGMLFFSANGQGYGAVRWGTYTGVPKWYYDFNHPAASSVYRGNFVGLNWVVKNGSRQEADGGYGLTGQFSARSATGQHEYPEEGEVWTMDSTHRWSYYGAGCGKYWRADTHTREPVAPYKPHRHAIGVTTFDNTVAQGYAIFDPNLAVVSGAPNPSGALVMELDGTPNAGSASQADSVINPLSGVSTGWTAPSTL